MSEEPSQQQQPTKKRCVARKSVNVITFLFIIFSFYSNREAFPEIPLSG